MKRSKASIPNSQAGFTLVEVLVVVIIAAILAGITAPSWFAFLNKQRVGAVRSDLLQGLKQAQQEAIQRREAVTVKVVNGDTPSLQVQGLTQALGSDGAGNVQLSYYTVDTAGTKTTQDSITFDYQGIPRGQVVPFVVSINAAGSTTKQCVIVANLLGSLKTAADANCDNPQVSNN
ncbi:MAG: GspH/FimT family pseudopilin [Nodosilinea sp.]